MPIDRTQNFLEQYDSFDSAFHYRKFPRLKMKSGQNKEKNLTLQWAINDICIR